MESLYLSIPAIDILVVVALGQQSLDGVFPNTQEVVLKMVSCMVGSSFSTLEFGVLDLCVQLRYVLLLNRLRHVRILLLRLLWVLVGSYHLLFISHLLRLILVLGSDGLRNDLT